jgi:hypothetical protein
MSDLEDASIKKNMVLLSIESDQASVNNKKFVKKGPQFDEWYYEGMNDKAITCKFVPDRIEIRIPSEDTGIVTEKDVEVFAGLVKASYSVVLGFRIENRTVELARIGSFTPTPKEDSR